PRLRYPGRRRAADVARLQIFALLDRVGREAIVGAFEESEHERGLGSWRALFDLVQRFLVAKVPVADRHRALLDDVVDAGDDAVRGHLALAEPDQGLDLAREAGRGGQ